MSSRALTSGAGCAHTDRSRNQQPFQFAKLPTTDDAAAGCSDMSKINEVHCIKIVYEGIKGIKPRKKDEKAQQSSTGQHDPVRKQESAWKKLGAVNERSDKGQFGLTPSCVCRFGSLDELSDLGPVLASALAPMTGFRRRLHKSRAMSRSTRIPTTMSTAPTSSLSSTSARPVCFAFIRRKARLN